jgi:hypothetical protein
MRDPRHRAGRHGRSETGGGVTPGEHNSPAEFTGLSDVVGRGPHQVGAAERTRLEVTAARARAALAYPGATAGGQR